jgi:hypothetical protein
VVGARNLTRQEILTPSFLALQVERKRQALSSSISSNNHGIFGSHSVDQVESTNKLFKSTLIPVSLTNQEIQEVSPSTSSSSGQTTHDIFSTEGSLQTNSSEMSSPFARSALTKKRKWIKLAISLLST